MRYKDLVWNIERTPDEQWNVMAEFHMVGTSTCDRCEDYHNMGLSDTCPSCDMAGDSL